MLCANYLLPELLLSFDSFELLLFAGGVAVLLPDALPVEFDDLAAGCLLCEGAGLLTACPVLLEGAGLLTACSLLLEAAGLPAALWLPCEGVLIAFPDDWLREGAGCPASLLSPPAGAGLEATSLLLPVDGL